MGKTWKEFCNTDIREVLSSLTTEEFFLLMERSGGMDNLAKRFINISYITITKSAEYEEVSKKAAAKGRFTIFEYIKNNSELGGKLFLILAEE